MASVIRAQNRVAHLCACGLYAPLNGSHLRAAGFSTVLGPEFEAELAQLAMILRPPCSRTLRDP